MPSTKPYAIEGIKSKIQQAVVLPLRDTDQSVQEIARSLKISYSQQHDQQPEHLP